MDYRRTYLSADIERLEHRRPLAGDPYLVEDLHQVPASSLPMDLTEFRGEVFFSAETDQHGRELWRSDGTDEGTLMVSDILPGPRGSHPSQLVVLGDQLYFKVNSGRVWKSDGTEAGTSKIVEFDSVYALDVFKDKLYFIGDGRVWQSDGTAAGSSPVGSAEHIEAWDLFVSEEAVFVAGRDKVGNGIWRISQEAIGEVLRGTAGAERFVQFNDEVFISGRDPKDEYRWRVWKIGPASETATLVQTFENASLSDMVASPSAVLFRVNRQVPEGRHPAEVWRTDGVDGGTYQLTFPGSEDFFPSWLMEGTRSVFISGFSYGDEMWSSDGTQAGTVRLESVTVQSRTPSDTAVINDEQFLLGAALWQTEGTEPGTIKIKDVEGPKYSAQVIGVGDTLYFNGQEEEGSELWKSDGTPEGTNLVRDIRPGLADLDENEDCFACPRGPHMLAAIHKQLYFTGSDGSLYITDGTVDAIREVADVSTDQIIQLNDVGLFQYAGSLWVTDGSEEGTRPYFEFEQTEDLQIQLTDAQLGNDSFFFLDSSASNRQLWKTDGTESGTSIVANLPEATSSIAEITVFADRLVFRVNTPTSQELWVSDGTSDNSGPVFDFGPPSDIPVHHTRDAANLPWDFENLGERLVFAVNTKEFGRELWATDGTSQGTERLTDIVVGEESSIRGSNHASSLHPLWVAGEQVFFAAGDGAVGSRAFGSSIYVSDGTKAGTRQIAGIDQNVRASIYEAIDFNGDLIFATSLSTEHGEELWRSDGTPEGTELIKDIHPGRWHGAPRGLTVFDGNVYFAASDRSNNRELWVTNGTPEGTHMVAEIRSGAEGSDPDSLVATGTHLFFTASDGTHGRELWALQGQSADFDQDGRTTFLDFLILAANFNKQDASFQDGDANGDRHVTFADFLLLAEQFDDRS